MLEVEPDNTAQGNTHVSKDELEAERDGRHGERKQPRGAARVDGGENAPDALAEWAAQTARAMGKYALPAELRAAGFIVPDGSIMLPPMPPFKDAETGRCEVVEYMDGRRKRNYLAAAAAFQAAL